MTVCLTCIRGGEALNVIPSTCKLTINARLPPRISCEEGTRLLEAIVRQHELENPDVKFKMAVKDRVEPFIAKQDTPLVKALMATIEDTIGSPARLLKKTGTGDMNVFGTRVKIPVATYGPGDSRLSHTLNEHVETNEYLTSIEVYRKTIRKMLNSHHKTTRG